jgi:2,5-diamino-6-(ribosylamino)-4(3H)-pyrimidinone 5'-phosphate reductase
MPDLPSDPRISLGKPDYTTLEFPEPPADRPYVVINMVMSLEGTVTVEGTERGLGSPTDQALMRELRVHADVVMNGASTLRASGTSSRVPEDFQALRRSRGKAPNPTAAVITRSGDLPLQRAFFTERDFDAMVYLADSAPRERREAIEATGRPAVVLPSDGLTEHMLAHMRHDLGAGLLLVEGGPHLNGSLFELGAVDEYFVTLGPVIVAGNKTLAAVVASRPPTIDGLTRLELVSLAFEPSTNEQYLRYRVARGS